MRLIGKEAPRAVGNRLFARQIGMNVNEFPRLFKKAALTPRQYLMRLRMESAYRFLQYSSESIEAMADKTGFCDRFHFSRAFKRHFHGGPSAFRRRAQREA